MAAKRKGKTKTGMALIGRVTVKTLRGKTGLSQTALARKLGVSSGAVSRWESGQTRPGRSARANLEAFARGRQRAQVGKASRSTTRVMKKAQKIRDSVSSGAAITSPAYEAAVRAADERRRSGGQPDKSPFWYLHMIAVRVPVAGSAVLLSNMAQEAKGSGGAIEVVDSTVTMP